MAYKTPENSFKKINNLDIEKNFFVHNFSLDKFFERIIIYSEDKKKEVLR
jgi:ribosomal protein L15E